MDLRHGSGGVRPTRRFVLAQVGVVVGATAVYFGVRTLTEGDVASADRNAGRVVELEQRLGIDHESGLQGLVLGREGLEKLANWIYIWGHWPVIAAVLIWLVVHVPDRYVVYRNAMLISGVVGLVSFALFPVTPPRLLDMGLIDTVTEQSHAYRVLQPPSLINQYAAMPSFHVGWDLLMGLALVREAQRQWLRALGFVLPVVMTLSVVVTANHYLLDAVVGGAIVVASLAIAIWLHGRRRHLVLATSNPDAVAPVAESTLSHSVHPKAS